MNQANQGSSSLKKLRLDPSIPLWLINAPDDVLHIFADFQIIRKPLSSKSKTSSESRFSLILFVYSELELTDYIHKLIPFIDHETLFWIMYPKQSGSMKSDLTAMRTRAWDVVADSGFRGQTSVSLNDDWTGMRFTNAPEKKPSSYGIPPEQRNDEGIDYVNRTVQLPPDAQAALDKHGLSELFYKQSFTNKKEAALAITTAKKPETRVKRIEKLVEEMKGKRG